MADYRRQQESIQNEQVQQLSKINSAQLINFRIDALWKDTHKHSRNGMFSSWNVDLDRIWMELVGDVEKNERDKLDETNKKLAKLGRLKNSYSSGFNKISNEDQDKKDKQYNLLMKKEEILRELMNDQGKGTAYQEGDDDYMKG